MAFGVSTADATAYALALHALILGSVVIAGAALAWRLGLGVRAIVRPEPDDGEPRAVRDTIGGPR